MLKHDQTFGSFDVGERPHAYTESSVVADLTAPIQTVGQARRFVRYGVVSLIPTIAGAALLALFVRGGMSALWANVWAVALPVTPAYILHRHITWRDREGVDLRRSLATFWAFAVVGAVASTVLVWSAGQVTTWAPALVAVQLGTFGVLWLIRYVVLDGVIFAGDLETKVPPRTLGSVPQPARTSMGTDAPSVAVFMPAYNEEGNIAETVRTMQATLDSCAREYTVIVVDDGSADATGTITADLARTVPGVWGIHHLENSGYGAALRTGFDAALATGHDWVFFTDSDGQFEPTQLAGFLRAAERTSADVVVGYRDERADPWHRRLNGKLWTWLSCAVMGIRFRDVDCAFKLFRREVVAGLTFTGEAASISPEVLAKASRRASRTVELSVWHFPRTAGEQTGAKLSVIIRSLVDLWRVRFALDK